jgi:hypothetical protein
MLIAFPNEHAPQLIKYLRKSKSQMRQDLFVLSQLKFKTNGYFVEQGAKHMTSQLFRSMICLLNMLLHTKLITFQSILKEVNVKY